MRFFIAMALMLAPAAVNAQAVLTSSNNKVRIGINSTGDLNGGSPYTGLAYNFSGQGGVSGYRDALTPGCACEAWGVAANGREGQVGRVTGNTNISFVSAAAGAGSYTSVTRLSNVSGLTVTQRFSEAASTATGALFVNQVTISNTTASTMTDVRYARAMDWDVPPTEYSEFTTFKGVSTTKTLLRSTDNGFASALPISGMSDPGRQGPINSDGTTGPSDHGAFFIFGFGDIAAMSNYTFNIYYGAGANQLDALNLLSNVSPELYNFGQSNASGKPATELPTYVFAFSGVGGSVVVPTVPEPSTWALMVVGFGGVAWAVRRRRATGGVVSLLA
ncbi:hypothetical protein QE361_002843 [Sphingomonas sp. SORGH_AS802]|uniref:PEPxxWA-CTERM sorting domain-containing protein n=1 Tax=unclassified Sphingomonas TaxID=196159 RepID=UPI00285CA5A5|nr:MULTISPECIES: PEPxxWA-CTERM sorting domain-containing protein [unclassified Sphingomonas]MDR6126311.1 hypothetical protein [Sphingomonas sp. SORGH_AS_0438]MDR6135844.1 hypothetical protein [Sphingomonas sp. SORGH_AS_0802]